MWRRGNGSKYNNRPLRCRQGAMHHSTLEAKWCDDLHVLQAGGRIRELEAHPQPKFSLDVNGVHVCFYLSDFRWVDCDTGATCVADAKGIRTREYELKKRLMLAVHGIEIEELGRAKARGWR